MSLGRALMRLREKRRKVEFRAGLVVPGKRDQFALVCDVSTAGLGGITTGDSLDAGDRALFLMADGREIAATVRWSIANQFGVAFDTAQDLAALIALDETDAPAGLPRSA